MSAMADSENRRRRLGASPAWTSPHDGRRQRDHEDPLHRPIRRLRRRCAVCTYLRRNLDGEGRDHAECGDRRAARRITVRPRGRDRRVRTPPPTVARAWAGCGAGARTRRPDDPDRERARATSATRSLGATRSLDQPRDAAERDRRAQRGQERTWEEAVADPPAQHAPEHQRADEVGRAVTEAERGHLGGVALEGRAHRRP